MTTCRNCHQWIYYAIGKWIHSDTGSVFCDLSGTVKAVPK